MSGFVPEFILTSVACAFFTNYLYTGYTSIATSGVTRALLQDPVLSFLELRVGDGLSVPPLPITGPVCYLLAVYLGSWFMAGRKPFQLQGVMAAYNIYATLLSLAMFVLFVVQFHTHAPGAAVLTYKLPAGGQSTRLWAAVMWVNMMSKYIEYVDTVVAVLRGKKEQVNDLQLFHHAEMAPLMFMFLSICPGGQSSLGPCINSLIHFIMYGYYALTGLKVLSGLTSLIKPYITILQILQFIICLVHSVFHLVYFDKYWDSRCALLQFFLMLQMRECAYPGSNKCHALFLPFYSLPLPLPLSLKPVYMFKEFFVRTYLKKKTT